MFGYNSILLDVPSTTDRISMNDLSSGNVFSPINTFTRQSLPTTQKNLLKKAIQLCRPGGNDAVFFLRMYRTFVRFSAVGYKNIWGIWGLF